MPFQIYADLTKEFEIGDNDKFQLVFENPMELCKTLIQPGACKLTDVQQGKDLTLFYESGGLEIRLLIALEKNSGTSDWSLQIVNTGNTQQEFLVNFPCLNGVRLGADSTTNMATTMDEAGFAIPAWERPGGVLGESNQMSMQWHAIWDPPSRNALGMIFMDPDIRPKRIELIEPKINLHYFPPVTLKPGESIDFPTARILVYEGNWKPAARAYRKWYGEAFTCPKPPEWFRKSNGSIGRHFKKGGPGIEADYEIQYALESFRELPQAHIRNPIDGWELAFFCEGSAHGKVHTDGDNIIRHDMGGVAAMRDGIEGSHRLGLHTTLYVEGFIVSATSDLAKSGKAARWGVMRKDGTQTGPYKKQGFEHMCPGCVEWQDHLVETVSRLLKETGADGVRLDSLGYYYLPCYNPAHNHETPFGYNQWLLQLLSKVGKAIEEIDPEILFTIEGPADWCGQYVHGALNSECPRDIPMMRLAVNPFRSYVYAGGSVWGSISGYSGGGCGGKEIELLDANWLCARFPAHEALVWREVMDDDPLSSDPEIVARQFEGDGYWAAVTVRPECQESKWPWKTGLSQKHGRYTLTFPNLAREVEEIIFCDIETLSWKRAEMKRRGKDILLDLETNWALIILRKRGGPQVVGFDLLPKLDTGESAVLKPYLLSKGPFTGPLTIRAPGLGLTPARIELGETGIISVPEDAYPGHYSVSISGENVLGIKRFLVVE